METSPKLSFKGVNRKKIGVGALMAIIGAILTYLTGVIGTIDFGPWTPIVVSGFSILANIVRKWMMETNLPTTPTP